jgi:hypothetical protein
MFVCWWRLGQEDRRRAWRLHGWYSGSMMVGSCFGAVAWSSNMMASTGKFSFSAGDVSKVAPTYSFLAVHGVTYAIEFLCLSAAKLMVLDRMSEFIAPQGTTVWKRWAVGGRVVMAVVAFGNLTGLAACVAAAVYWKRSFDAESTALSYSAANNIAKASESRKTSIEEDRRAFSIYSVQQMCEVAVLLFIVTAFLFTGVLCARRVSVALRGVQKISAIQAFYSRSRSLQAAAPALAEAAAQGRNLQLRMVATTAVVFAAFLLRSVLSTMIAVAYALSDFSGKKCPGVTSLCDASCYNVYTHMFVWSFYTPEFKPTAVLITSPLVLLVVMWSMTTKIIWQRMKLSQRNEAALQAIAAD